MKIASLVLYMFIIIVLGSAVYATSSNSYAVIGQNISLIADSFNGGQYYTYGNVNISIYSPNLTLLINNSQMTEIKNGLFIYNYTPLNVGNYYVAYLYYNNSGNLLYTATETFYVSSIELPTTGGQSMSIGFAAIVGISLFCALLLYVSNKVIEDNRNIMKTISVFVTLMSCVLISKFMIDSYNQCALTVANAVTTATGTAYTYALTCQNYTSPYLESFYWLSVVLFSAFMFYTVVKLILFALDKLKEAGSYIGK